jgi:drug/metabolite transporter (DMT)-like permease
VRSRALARPTGVGYAVLAAVLFGVSTPVAKAFLRNTPPQLLAGMLYLGSGGGLAIVSIVRRSRGIEAEARLTRRDAPWLTLAILFGGVLAPVLLLIGLTRTPAASTSLLLNLEGVFTALLAWLVFRENVDRRIAVGMFAIVVGGAVLSWEGHAAFGGVLGPVAIAAACAGWAIDNNLTQKVSGGDPIQIAMLKGLAAGTVNVIIAMRSARAGRVRHGPVRRWCSGFSAMV